MNWFKVRFRKESSCTLLSDALNYIKPYFLLLLPSSFPPSIRADHLGRLLAASLETQIPEENHSFNSLAASCQWGIHAFTFSQSFLYYPQCSSHCSRNLHILKRFWCHFLCPPRVPSHKPACVSVSQALPRAHTWGPQMLSLAISAFTGFIHLARDWGCFLSLCINFQMQGRVINNLFCQQFYLVSSCFRY